MRYKMAEKQTNVIIVQLEDRFMKKTMSFILITVMLFTLLLPVTGCTEKTDYSSPIAAVKAADNGVNIIGKTVKIKATSDVALGYFYGEMDIGIGANVAVGVYKEDSFLGLDMDYEGIKEGQTIVGTIKYYDDSIRTSRIILVSIDK